MGYYDNGGRRSTFFVAIISAIVGGLIVGLILTPVFLFRDTFFSDKKTESPSLSANHGPTVSTSVKVNSDITKAVNKVKPAVVGIVNFAESGDPLNPQKKSQGTGSGIIFERTNGKARVVTNNHVIAGSSDLQVIIPYKDGSKTVQAKLLGGDSVTDLAVLEINDQYVTNVAQFGNAATLQAGEPAIAIGNPLGLESSVTTGVISSPKRSIDVTEYMATDAIQTDAAINPGNSGGALVNAAGQVIGINSLKIAESGVEGLGFAIPVNDAVPIINSLIKNGEVPRPYFGVTLIDLKELPENVWNETLQLPNTIQGGTVVRSVSASTPAARSGLRPKDVIVKLDNQGIKTRSELRSYLYKSKKPLDSVKVTFYRNGKLQTTDLKLTKAPTAQAS